jgi:hypothetical protein
MMWTCPFGSRFLNSLELGLEPKATCGLQPQMPLTELQDDHQIPPEECLRVHHFSIFSLLGFAFSYASP